MIPNDCKYTQEHEWIRVEDEVAYAGITEYAAEQLGDITFVDLPEVGDQFARGDVIAEVESVKAVSDVYCPVGGSVVTVNEDLQDEPGLINSRPYDDGWLCTIRIEDEDELEELMAAEQYRELLEEEEDED
jgi:glycine cleavage system H protein